MLLDALERICPYFEKIDRIASDKPNVRPLFLTTSHGKSRALSTTPSIPNSSRLYHLEEEDEGDEGDEGDKDGERDEIEEKDEIEEDEIEEEDEDEDEIEEEDETEEEDEIEQEEKNYFTTTPTTTPRRKTQKVIASKRGKVTKAVEGIRPAIYNKFEHKRSRGNKTFGLGDALYYSNESKMEFEAKKFKQQERDHREKRQDREIERQEREREHAEEARRWNQKLEFDREQSQQRHDQAMKQMEIQRLQLELQSKKFELELEMLRRK